MHNSNYLKAFGICVGIVSYALSINLTLAAPLKVESSSQYLLSLEFPPPPDSTIEPPKSTAGAARRAPKFCIYSSDQLLRSDGKPLDTVVALMPHQKRSGQEIKALVKTSSSRPGFWFYIPKTRATSAQFIIRDEASNEIEGQEIQLSDSPGMIAGIIQVSLLNQNVLEIGKKYSWEFKLNCPPKTPLPGEVIQTKGEIERVNLDPSIQSSLKKTINSFERAEIYASKQLWPETLMSLIRADLHRYKPEEWEELLQSVGLENFIRVPIVDCCQTKN